MHAQKKYKNKYPGFTLIEALAFIFIFSLISITFYQVIILGSHYILFSKYRLGAVSIANEKMEIARNLDYDNVGIQGGACGGNMAQDEDVAENGRLFHVHTLVAYVDDASDGTLGGNPNDTAYEDYKKVDISVSWDSGPDNRGSVEVSSLFAPDGLEAATSGDGILSINVSSNENGTIAPVQGASLHITNGDLGFSETRQTDSSGNVMVVGAHESIQKYHIEISKDGYEDVATYQPFPDSDFTPVDVDATVISDSLNVANIMENKLSDLKIITVDPKGDPVKNVAFSLKGGRIIGNEVAPPDNPPIYNLDATDSTGDDGEKNYPSISPGQYTFTPDFSASNYVLIRTDPPSPLSLNSGQNLDLKVELADKSVTAALVKVAKGADHAPLAGATVNLKNASGYDETITTDGNGTAYFPADGSDSFESGAYDLSVKADGFADNASQIQVSSNQLTQSSVLMVSN